MLVHKGQKFIQTSQIDWQMVSDGIRRKITGYDEHVMAVCVEFRKGASAASHKHSHRQITHIHSGTFEVSIGGEQRILHTGDFFYIPPDIEHGVVALEEGLLIDTFVPMREDFLT